MVVLLSAVLAAGSIGLAYRGPIVFGPSGYPSAFPIPAGSVIRFRPLEAGSEGTFAVPFDVSSATGRLVGRWYADHGGAVYVYRGDVPLLLPHPHYCNVPWAGFVDLPLAAGHYIFQFFGPRWDNVSIEKSIQVLYLGSSTDEGSASLASPCHPS